MNLKSKLKDTLIRKFGPSVSQHIPLLPNYWKKTGIFIVLLACVIYGIIMGTPLQGSYSGALLKTIFYSAVLLGFTLEIASRTKYHDEDSKIMRIQSLAWAGLLTLVISIVAGPFYMYFGDTGDVHPITRFMFLFIFVFYINFFSRKLYMELEATIAAEDEDPDKEILSATSGPTDKQKDSFFKPFLPVLSYRFNLYGFITIGISILLVFLTGKMGFAIFRPYNNFFRILTIDLLIAGLAMIAWASLKVENFRRQFMRTSALLFSVTLTIILKTMGEYFDPIYGYQLLCLRFLVVLLLGFWLLLGLERLARSKKNHVGNAQPPQPGTDN